VHVPHKDGVGVEYGRRRLQEALGHETGTCARAIVCVRVSV
jgi:hypothetical protein